jgi:hypothetical protein
MKNIKETYTSSSITSCSDHISLCLPSSFEDEIGAGIVPRNSRGSFIETAKSGGCLCITPVSWSNQDAEGGVVHQCVAWSLQPSQEETHQPKSLQKSPK